MFADILRLGTAATLRSDEAFKVGHILYVASGLGLHLCNSVTLLDLEI